MKGRVFELYVLPAILIVSLFLPHIFFFGNHYVDVELCYVEAALEIADHGFDASLSSYFANVANPISTVLILSGSYKLLWGKPCY